MGDLRMFISDRTREAGSNLARTVKAMPADRQTWKALECGRSALDQVQECAVFNALLAEILRERRAPVFEKGAYDSARSELDSIEKALAAMKESTGLLVAAIRDFPKDRLEETLELPFLNGLVRPFEWVLNLGCMNMMYHYGQVSFIQTLYGDLATH